MTWDPLARRDPVRKPIPSSKIDGPCPADQETVDGVPYAAWATFRAWSARERLAYEDAMSTRLLVDDEVASGLKLGTLRLVHLGLTIESVEGFPETVDVDTFDAAGARSREAVPFDPRSERCLLALDPDVLSELSTMARDVEPVPGSQPADDDPDEASSGATEGAADEDPSPTPSTPPPTAQESTEGPTEPA